MSPRITLGQFRRLTRRYQDAARDHADHARVGAPASSPWSPVNDDRGALKGLEDPGKGARGQEDPTQGQPAGRRGPCGAPRDPAGNPTQATPDPDTEGPEVMAPIYPYGAGTGDACQEAEIGLDDLSDADLDVLHEVDALLGAEANPLPLGGGDLGGGDLGDGPTGGDDPFAQDPYGRLGRLVLEERTVYSLIESFPGLVDEAHRGLLLHALFGIHLHKSEDKGGHTYVRPMIPAPFLAKLEGKETRERSKNYRGEDFLEAHRGVLRHFEYTGYWRGRYPRQVRRHGLHLEHRCLVEADLEKPPSLLVRPTYAFTLTRVADATTGRAAQEAKAHRDRLIEAARRQADDAPCGLQAALLRYLNGRSPHALSRLAKRNAQAAITAAMAEGDESKRFRDLMALRLVLAWPHQLYQRSRRGGTVRVFPFNEGPITLPRRVRRALMGGCLEADLANAHLAIAAWAWGVESVMDLLGRDAGGRPRKAWPALFRAVGRGHVAEGSEEYGRLKKALKPALYAAVYGMSEDGLRLTVMRSLGYEAACLFLEAPLIRDLLEARDRALAEIDRDGHARDCFGNAYEVWATESEAMRARQARSALAGVMQAWELKLFEDVIEDAVLESRKPNPAYHVLAWQHDGFTASVSKNKDSVRRRLERLVDEKAEALGIPTFLETEWLG